MAGGAGTDTLNLDWSGHPSLGGGAAFSLRQASGTWLSFGNGTGGTPPTVNTLLAAFAATPTHYKYSYNYNSSEHSAVTWDNLERINVTGAGGNDLLVYQNGTRYVGGGGTDTFFGDFSTWTESVTWLNESQGSSALYYSNNAATLLGATHQVSVAGMERLLLLTGSGNDSITQNVSNTNDEFRLGAGNDFAFANSGNDILQGGDGNDILGGGLGADTLDGGGGADSFLYVSATEFGDQILDFQHGVDTLHFDTTDAGGSFASGLRFSTLVGAADGASPVLYYNPAVSQLLYDADGTGSGAAVAVATFADGPALNARDIVIDRGEIGASASAYGTLGLGAAAAMGGTLETLGDHDWYRIALTSGVRYTFDLEGLATGQGGLADPVLYLRNATGTQLTADDNTGIGRNSRLTYTATATGFYFLDVGAYANASAGSYRLSAAQGAASLDDYGAATSSYGTLGLGAAAAMSGTLETLGDRDWFRVYLANGTRYTFDLEGLATGQGGLADPVLSLRNAAGTQLTADDNTGIGRNARLTYTATAAGFYFLDVGAYANAYTGSYRLSMAQGAASLDDYGASAATSGILGIGTKMASTGVIENTDDCDWFRVYLTSGVQYTVDAEGVDSFGGSLANPHLILRDSAGSIINSDDNTGIGANAQLTYTAASTGFYYLNVSASDTGLGSYTVSVSQGAYSADDCGASTTSYGLTDVNRTIQGVLERGSDHDWYGIYLDNGNSYTFNLGGSYSQGGSLVNPSLALRNAEGVLLISNDNHSTLTDARLTYTATSSGWYYLDAYSSDTDNGPGGYSLTTALGTSALDDYGSSTSSYASMAMGSAAYGALENSDDVDWFKVTLTGGQLYTFDAYGASTGNGSLADPYLSVFDASGTLVSTSDGGGTGTDARLGFTPGATEDYYIEVSGHGALGGYRLSGVADSGLGAQVETSWLSTISDLSLTPSIATGSGTGYAFTDEERRILNSGMLAA